MYFSSDFGSNGETNGCLSAFEMNRQYAADDNDKVKIHSMPRENKNKTSYLTITGFFITRIPPGIAIDVNFLLLIKEKLNAMKRCFND